MENLVLAVYNVDTRPGLYVTNRLRFTHAWLPCERFDEVIEEEGWILARRGDGYIRHQEHVLELDWSSAGREASSTI